MLRHFNFVILISFFILFRHSLFTRPSAIQTQPQIGWSISSNPGATQIVWTCASISRPRIIIIELWWGGVCSLFVGIACFVLWMLCGRAAGGLDRDRDRRSATLSPNQSAGGGSLKIGRPRSRSKSPFRSFRWKRGSSRAPNADSDDDGADGGMNSKHPKHPVSPLHQPPFLSLYPA